MTLNRKIKENSSQILLYGITPPKAENSKDKIEQIAQKHINRISKLPIDGLVLYDIQDESQRTDEKRPFPFIKTLDPCEYAKGYLQDLEIPRIIYRAVGKYDVEEFSNWLEQTKVSQLHSVFVGAASSNQVTPLNIKKAYKLKESINDKLCLGGIAIPERHTVKHDEHLRVISKTNQGCEFFITQCVYDVEASKKFLYDYSQELKKTNTKSVPIIFTLTPCGSTKTLDFMKWLGINIPKNLEEDLKNSKEILEDSVKLSEDIFKTLYDYGKELNIAIGCNVESVAIRKEEIEASIELLHSVNKIMNKN